VLAVNDGVVLRVGDRIEILRDDGVPTRVIFDKVPDNLRPQPTLSVMVDAERAGPRQARLSYLTTGLSWKADYVAFFDERAGKLDLQGWITMTNQTGTTFENVETRLVAGNVSVLRTPRQYRSSIAPVAQTRAATIGTPRSGPERRDADYHLYPLPERTTIADKQSKQVAFLEAQGVTASKSYSYSANSFSSDQIPSNASVELHFANDTRSGLSAALPEGLVRVYIKDSSGEPTFAGENRVGHTPQGSELVVTIGEAFDVTVLPTLLQEEKINDRRTRYSMSYAFRNARPEPVTVEFDQTWLDNTNGRVVRESVPGRRVDADTWSWKVPVPASGEATLTFTAEDR
jgi:hypothetical protein